MIGQITKTVPAGVVLLGFAAVLALSGVARADEHERHDEGREHHEEGRGPHGEGRGEHEVFIGRDRQAFHERDVHRFNEVEFGRWRGGQWRNSCFSGRCGWWWFAGGEWYFYDRPEYPYPSIVSEYAYIEPAPVYAAPPPVYAPPPPVYVAPRPMPPPAQPQVYYYCDNPAGYYPYVPSCPTQFRPVPAPPR